MSETLIVAIPSKGRLQDNTNAFFARAGLVIERPGGERNYRGRFRDLEDVEIAFLSASEISSELAAGTVHLGVTGLDLVHEAMPGASDRAAHVHPVLALDFGHADVVLAVPDPWIDVETMSDLGDVALDFRARRHARLRIATKYVNLTNAFCAGFGFTDYRIVDSLGATEGAPAAGAADVIVDITTSGATLRANHLRVLADGVLLRSQAHLLAAKTAAWSERMLAAARKILARIAAEQTARPLKMLTLGGSLTSPQRQRLEDDFRCRLPFTGTTGPGEILYCPQATLFDAVAWLQHAGIRDIAVTDPDLVFLPDNPLYGALRSAVAPE